jgi:hypothetical protein
VERRIAGHVIRDVLVECLFDCRWLNESPVDSRSTTGPMPLRNAELAPTWTDSPQGAFILLTVTS